MLLYVKYYLLFFYSFRFSLFRFQTSDFNFTFFFFNFTFFSFFSFKSEIVWPPSGGQGLDEELIRMVRVGASHTMHSLSGNLDNYRTTRNLKHLLFDGVGGSAEKQMMTFLGRTAYCSHEMPHSNVWWLRQVIQRFGQLRFQNTVWISFEWWICVYCGHFFHDDHLNSFCFSSNHPNFQCCECLKPKAPNLIIPVSPSSKHLKVKITIWKGKFEVWNLKTEHLKLKKFTFTFSKSVFCFLFILHLKPVFQLSLFFRFSKLFVPIWHHNIQSRDGCQTFCVFFPNESFRCTTRDSSCSFKNELQAGRILVFSSEDEDSYLNFHI